MPICSRFFGSKPMRTSAPVARRRSIPVAIDQRHAQIRSERASTMVVTPSRSPLLSLRRLLDRSRQPRRGRPRPRSSVQVTRFGPIRPVTGTPAHRLERRLPWRQREGVLAPDDGDLAGRRRDRAVVDAGDAAARFVVDDGLALRCRDRSRTRRSVSAWRRLRIMSGFGAMSPATAILGELALCQPPTASGKRLREARWRTHAASAPAATCEMIA